MHRCARGGGPPCGHVLALRDRKSTAAGLGTCVRQQEFRVPGCLCGHAAVQQHGQTGLSSACALSACSLARGPAQQALLYQGLMVAEFLKLYADACEARAMGLHELYVATAWPLDNPELPRLLQQLLLVRGRAGRGRAAAGMQERSKGERCRGCWAHVGGRVAKAGKEAVASRCSRLAPARQEQGRASARRQPEACAVFS